MQSVPITTNVVSLNPAHGEVYLIQHYVIKFVSLSCFEFSDSVLFFHILLFTTCFVFIHFFVNIYLSLFHYIFCILIATGF
jgi:hypothetical protein